MSDKIGLIQLWCLIKYNKTIYNLCKTEFSKSDFKPWDVKEVWEKVRVNL